MGNAAVNQGKAEGTTNMNGALGYAKGQTEWDRLRSSPELAVSNCARACTIGLDSLQGAVVGCLNAQQRVDLFGDCGHTKKQYIL